MVAEGTVMAGPQAPDGIPAGSYQLPLIMGGVVLPEQALYHKETPPESEAMSIVWPLEQPIWRLQAASMMLAWTFWS